MRTAQQKKDLMTRIALEKAIRINDLFSDFKLEEGGMGGTRPEPDQVPAGPVPSPV